MAHPARESLAGMGSVMRCEVKVLVEVEAGSGVSEPPVTAGGPIVLECIGKGPRYYFDVARVWMIVVLSETRALAPIGGSSVSCRKASLVAMKCSHRLNLLSPHDRGLAFAAERHSCAPSSAMAMHLAQTGDACVAAWGYC